MGYRIPRNTGCINANFLINLFAEIEQEFEDLRPLRRQSILDYKREFSDLLQQRRSAIDLAISNGFDTNELMHQGHLKFLSTKDRERPTILSLFH